MQIDPCPKCGQYVIDGDGETRHAEEVLIFPSPTEPDLKPLDTGTDNEGRRYVVTVVLPVPQDSGVGELLEHWQVRGVYLDPVE